MAIKVKKTGGKKVGGKSSGGACKWCEQGECWTHGQIEQPKRKAKGGGKGGKGGGNQGGGVWLSNEQLQQLLSGGGKGGTWVNLGGGGGGGGKGGGKRGGGGKSSDRNGRFAKTFKLDKSGGELGEYTGVIKSFAMGTNYGFIECDELAEEYGDIFLHGNMKFGYRKGQTVKFTCVLNKEGKPVACDLKSGLK